MRLVLCLLILSVGGGFYLGLRYGNISLQWLKSKLRIARQLW